MNLPTKEQCLKYFDQYHVPGNIKKHCIKVTEVAVFLAVQLQKAGITINLDLVRCAAYLHDLFKVVVIEDLQPSEEYHPEPYSEQEIAMWKQLRAKYPGKYESEVAFEIFNNEFPELALTVRNSSDHRSIEKTWEELVVHYADWRVRQEKVVLLDDRLAYLRQRYSRKDDAWDRYSFVIKNHEKKIFSHLTFTPDDLKTALLEAKEPGKTGTGTLQ